ncbi:unnamed protein product [Mytilus edulis]|uniref:Uncharacterized protein n=1 Tax=Mytilus edulis TaxID=6550 RepID=A0A8S3RMG0_MYTED|nr:unnamed protein product [Mytilus edulis]
MAEENNLSLDTETSYEELSDNNVEGGLKNDSLTESNIGQSDIKNSKSNPLSKVSDRDHDNLNVKDTKLNKTDGKEKEIDFLIKSLKEDSCVESSVDSSELLQSIDKQNTTKEDEVERETIVSENYYDTNVGSSDLSLEESVDRNDKIKTLSDGQHESFESTNFTTVHPRQSMNSSASIERNEGEQTCEIKCASAKFFDEAQVMIANKGQRQRLHKNKPPETFASTDSERQNSSEFASFYHFLIEEEQTVLDNIDTSLDKYRTQNRSCEQLCGSVVEYEADLMSKSLSLMEKDDPFGINLNFVPGFSNSNRERVFTDIGLESLMNDFITVGPATISLFRIVCLS